MVGKRENRKCRMQGMQGRVEESEKWKTGFRKSDDVWSDTKNSYRLIRKWTTLTSDDTR